MCIILSSIVQYIHPAEDGPFTAITGIRKPSPPLYHEKQTLVLPPNHTAGSVEQYDYSTVKHFGGFDVKGAALEAAAKTQTAMKKLNIPDTDQHYAHGHLVYNKRYASYV